MIDRKRGLTLTLPPTCLSTTPVKQIIMKKLKNVDLKITINLNHKTTHVGYVKSRKIIVLVELEASLLA